MKKIVDEWKWVAAGLVVVLLVGFGMRIINLTIFPIFADEAIYIRWSQIMGNEPTLRFLPLSDGKQPLFMWILMFLVSRVQDPLWIGRFISVGTGLGSILGIFVLIYILFKDKRAALTASLVWMINPIAFFFDRMALVDSLLTMLIIWVAIFGALTAKYRRFDLAMITGFLLGLTALTKSPALFTALLLPSVFLVGKWPKKKERYGFVLISVVYLLIIWGIAFGMYNILRLGPNFHMLTTRTKDYVYPISHLWESPLDPFKPYMDRAFRWIWQMGIGAIYLLIALGIYVSWVKKQRKEMLFLIIWFLIPLMIDAMFSKTFTVRYILYTLPFLFGLSGLGIGLNNNLKKGFMLILGVYVLLAMKFNYVLATKPESANLPQSERSGYLEEWSSGIGIYESAEYIKEMAAYYPDKKIVVGTEGYFGTLPDGMQIYMEGVSNVTVIGIGRNISNIPVELVESKEAGNETYLMANKSRLTDEFDFDKVEIIMSFKKPNRSINTHEYVQYGEYDTFYLMKI